MAGVDATRGPLGCGREAQLISPCHVERYVAVARYVVVWGPKGATFADVDVALEWLVERMFQWCGGDGDEGFVYVLSDKVAVEDALVVAGRAWRHGHNNVRSVRDGSDLVRSYSMMDGKMHRLGDA